MIIDIYVMIVVIFMVYWNYDDVATRSIYYFGSTHNYWLQVLMMYRF